MQNSNEEVLPTPEPPLISRLSHHTVDLLWESHVKELENKCQKGDKRVRICVQQANDSQSWTNVYLGYAVSHHIEGLNMDSSYHYRMRFQTEENVGEWSSPVKVTTLKEPLSGEHLNKAAQKQDIDEMERILETGEVHVDTPDKLGFTALMHSCQKGYIEITETLIKYRADVNLVSEAGKTPLMMACFAGQLPIVKLLRQHGAVYDIRDKGGSSALHWAVDGGNADLVHWMVEDGADVNIRDPKSGWTPLLRCASVNGNYNVASVLLLCNANINAQDHDGKTALMVAVINGHIQLIELLLQRNADMTIKNMFGKSAYEMALTMDKRRVIKTIEEFCQKKGIKIR